VNFERKDAVLLAALAIAAAGALAVYGFLGRHPGLPEGLIQASGRIEGDRYTAAAKYAGRIRLLLAREGDAVIDGQVLAQMDDARTQAQVLQARAGQQALQASLEAVRTDLAVLRKAVPLKIETAEADVAHARAALAAGEARAHQTRIDATRYAELVKKGGVDRYQSDQADLAWRVARAEFATARAALTRAETQLEEALLGPERIRAKESEVAAAAAQLAQAQAQLAEVQSVLDDLSVRAPASGIVTTRIVDAGEVVTAGAPFFDIVDLDRLYLKVYVPERQIGKLRLDLPARVYTDAFPEQPFAARVRYIASRAEFTPKEVQTTDERVKLVFAAKLYLDENPEHRLSPGLPADAVIRWKEETPWERPHW